jgi:hypothetical protein
MSSLMLIICLHTILLLGLVVEISNGTNVFVVKCSCICVNVNGNVILLIVDSTQMRFSLYNSLFLPPPNIKHCHFCLKTFVMLLFSTSVIGDLVLVSRLVLIQRHIVEVLKNCCGAGFVALVQLHIRSGSGHRKLVKNSFIPSSKVIKIPMLSVL